MTVDAVEAVYDLGPGLVTFNIDFSEPPDFVSVDEFDRQRTGFAIFIDNQGGLDPLDGSNNYARLDVILWGEDLSDGVVVIDKDLENGNVDYGGWGVATGFFAYTLSGDLMTWAMPLSAIGETGDGLFSYSFGVTEFGSQTDFVEAKSHAVGAIPTPSSGISALLALALLLGAGWRRMGCRAICPAV